MQVIVVMINRWLVHFSEDLANNIFAFITEISRLFPCICMYVLHLFLANKTRATQKNTSKQQPKIGNSNKRYTLRRTTFTCKTHDKSN